MLKVSIIISAYDQADFLGQAIESALRERPRTANRVTVLAAVANHAAAGS
jgi:glycosyltransferase involved in cell wall biosynthesis